MSLTKFQNRAAWQIESDEIRATVMQCGGHIAETLYRPTGINPLWIQDRPTIDADQYDPLIHGSVYGDDGEGKLISGLLGHNLCIPYWGLPSETEYRRGMTCHGEPNTVRWQEQLHAADRLCLTATLPESGLRLNRNLRCEGSIVHFETTVENLLSLDRPIAWCEHVTIGPPFLSSRETGFWASAGRGYRTTTNFNDVFSWPEGRGQILSDLSRFASQPHSDLVNSFLVEADGGYGVFATWNARLGSIFGYCFPAQQFGWLNVWENNDERMKTRGMEFSSTPIEGSMKRLIATPRVLDQPTFEWLDARSYITKKFFSFTLAIPSSFKGVASIRFDGEVIEILESGKSSAGRLHVGSELDAGRAIPP
jgi:hypothetical protein